MANNQQENAQRVTTISEPSNGEPATLESAEEVWDEARLEEAMETLKEMHIQLRNLRTTIPRLIAPLTVKQPSPDVLFREFTNSINTTNKEVQDFRTLMTSKEGSEVMARAKKSRTENPDGIKTWKVKDHPDWLTKNSNPGQEPGRGS